MTPELQEHPIALNNPPTWTPLAISSIATTAQYLACADHLKTIKAYQKRVAEFFKPHKQRLDEAKAALLTDERKALAQANEDEGICKRAMVAWNDEQERLRRLEEARLREAARLDDERRQLDEAAAIEMEADRNDDPELRSLATQLLEAPIPTPAIIAPRTTPKVAGITFRETWSARITNQRALIAYVAAHPECVNFIVPNLTALNAAVRAQRQGFNVPGVEAVCQKVAAAGSR